MTNEYEELGVYRQPFYGIPLTVRYRYIEPEEGGPDAELRSVHFPCYPEIDVKEGLSYDWISTCEANAMYYEQNGRSGAKRDTDHFESFEDLAAILGTSYMEAKDREAVTTIHLFGVRYAEDIRYCGRSVTEIVKRSSIPNSYATEVHKGVRLAKFVKLK